MSRNLVSALGALALSLAASSAQASGFDATRIGGEFGHAAAPNSFAVYYNPAALAGTRKIHLTADITLALHSASYDRTASTEEEPDDAQGANIGEAKLFDVLAAPSLAGSVHFGDFAAGIGVFAPMSGTQSWDGNSAFDGNTEYPGAQDGTARWHMIEGEFALLYASAAASYTLRSIGLSFGAGANLVYNSVRLLRARTSPGHDDVDTEGRIDMDLGSITGSFSVGALWEIVANKLWLGLSYQAPPGLYDGNALEGKLRVYLTSENASDVELQQKLPDVIRWALRYRAERYELRLFGDYTRWSTLERQCLVAKGEECALNQDGSQVDLMAHIPSNHARKWHDAVGVRLGASYWFSTQWEGFAGLGYDGNAIPDGHLEPGIVDGHDLSVALGGRVALGDHVTLSLSYTHVQMLSRTVDNSKLDHYAVPTRLPTANGEYTQWTGMINSMLEVGFD